VFSQQINNAKGLEDKRKLLDSYQTAKNEYTKRAEILGRWREVIFETSCSTTEDKENGHFKRFDSAKDLSDDEVIDRVELFVKALSKIVGYDENHVVYSFGEAKNCPQCPHRHHMGPLD